MAADSVGLLAADGVDPFFRIVEAEWARADDDGSGSLDLKEVTSLLQHLNLFFKKKAIKRKFAEYDVDGNGTLNFTEFMAFLNELRDRPEINQVFAKYSEGQDHMTARQFHAFLSESQLELSVTMNDVHALICEIERSESARYLYLSGFTAFMMSDRNSWKDPRECTVNEDMNQPLSHYFVNSSHNTYCESDQLKGNSSVQMYVRVLELGGRCVELDCWDGPDGEPLIYHGRTLTSRIKFRDVVQAIMDHGFTHSPFPVILSLENHCSHDQQRVMVDIMTEIFGDRLIPAFDNIHELPSPNSLRGRVLLKGKTIVTVGDDGDGDFASEVDSEVDSEMDDDDSAGALSDDSGAGIVMEDSAAKNKKKKKRKNKLGVFGRFIGGAARRMTVTARVPGTGKKAKKEKVAPELSRIIHLCGAHFQSFQESALSARCNEMSSFSENKTAKLVRSQAPAFVDYNKRQVARIYPKGTRIDSSNYDPYLGWLVGAQLVALNFQTLSTRMWLNQGFFASNGHCGYRLKPWFMRYEGMHWSPTDNHQGIMDISVEIISGWQLKQNIEDDPERASAKGKSKVAEIIDPYVIADLRGVPADDAQTKTSVIKNNGFNPVWRHKHLFHVSVPEIATLMFRVYDSDLVSKDDFIAYACLPVHAIRSGYRHVALFDHNHEPLQGSSLFCRFQFT